MALQLKRVHDSSKSLGGRLTVDERKDERQTSRNEWQNRWNVTTIGRWTHRLIRNVQAWVEGKYGETDF